MSNGRSGPALLGSALVAALLCGWLSCEAPAEESAAGDPALGERLYRAGTTASGAPLAAFLNHDVPAAGAAVACATCHRPSGYGGVEGTAFVPPITGPTLFAPFEPRWIELYEKLFQTPLDPTWWQRLRQLPTRPAYDTATLGRALRQGIDSTGRELDPLMPRYTLSDADLAHLAAYLATLSAAPAPGVDDTTIRFATVVAEGNESTAQTLQAVIDAYLRWRNANVDRILARRDRLSWDDAAPLSTWRRWAVERWTLAGPAATWREQLERRYAEQPVFALLGGTAGGSWQPIQEFCEARRVPCLFPLTDLPGDAPGFYTVYYSRGLLLEAEALAQHLAGGDERPRVLQAFRPGTAGAAAAARFRALWPDVEEVELTESTLPGQLAGSAAPPVLVLWLDAGDLAQLVLPSPATGSRLFVSRTLAGDAVFAGTPLPPPWRDRVYVLSRSPLPGDEGPHGYRVRAWLRSRGVRLEGPHDERTAIDGYFALSVVDDALARMIDRYSRELLLETVERELENTPNPGVYPRLSLGADQRYAAKGCYVVRLAPPDAARPTAVEWIVPSSASASPTATAGAPPAGTPAPSSPASRP